MLRYNADLRTVFYMIVTTVLLAVQWTLGEVQPVLYVWSLFMAISVSVIAHNHNHVPIWTSRAMNVFQDYWLTLFYGFPAFGWIPTHNRNHHNLNNKEGDYTITYRYSENNNLITLLTYPSISSYFQQKPIGDYLKHLWEKDRPRFYLAAGQYVALILWCAVALYIDWRKAVLFILIPHQVALFSVLIFNYIQHVHADEESAVNHSRNFIGTALNVMLFNNGFHTVHHDKSSMHWSETPEAHAKIAHNLDPVLIERSFWGYIGRVYILGLFNPKFRTTSMRIRRQGSGELGKVAA
ncbi:MAG: fatty acid desaturase [Rhizobacter sp.]|nr:fatty acid desaturase [Chlorobiales bacterium]